jgi:hypothetical protein
VRVAALNKEGVGIVALGQEDAASGNTLRVKTMGQLLGGLLAALVVIDIEGEIDGAWPSHSWRNWSALRWVPNEQVTL